MRKEVNRKGVTMIWGRSVYVLVGVSNPVYRNGLLDEVRHGKVTAWQYSTDSAGLGTYPLVQRLFRYIRFVWRRWWWLFSECVIRGVSEVKEGI